MSLPPIHRSRLFWLGLPGLLFLLWGWWDSWQHYSEIAWVRPKSVVMAFDHRGYVGFAVTKEAPAPVFGGAKFQVQREDHAPFWRDLGVSGFFGPEAKDLHEEARIHFLPGLYHRRWSQPYLSSPSATGSCDWLPYRELGADWWLLVVAYAFTWLLAMFGWRRRKRRLARGFASR